MSATSTRRRRRPASAGKTPESSAAMPSSKRLGGLPWKERIPEGACGCPQPPPGLLVTFVFTLFAVAVVAAIAPRDI